MRVIVNIVAGLLIIAGLAKAEMFQSVSSDKAVLLQTGKGKRYCPNCGMELQKFYKTSHAMKQKDGSIHQYCSIHCLAEANDEITPDTQVVDTETLKFIPAFTAFYVVGSSKPGTMTMNSKYAFGTKEAAEAFAKANGGKVMGFAEAVQLAADDIAKDDIMIEKKRMMAAEKGKMMYAKLCKQDELPAFGSIAEAKTYIVENDTCGTLKDKQYQAIAIYLMKRDAMATASSKAIHVTHGAKCPVCGMFVEKYPKWAAEIKIDGYTHLFDGVKDMMKFYLTPAAYHKDATREMITEMLVTDYYTFEAIDARKAWYVSGSNVYGPMGNELVPFKTREDAETFKKDHFGKAVLTFDTITSEIVTSLDK